MKIRDILFAFLFFGAIAFLGYFVEQSSFYRILIAYSIAFTAYYYFVHFKKEIQLSLKNGILLGITARLLLLFSFPALSDDIYRFIWDGSLINYNINPFEYLPSDRSINGLNGFIYDDSLYVLLNSPNYYSIYPPLSQLLFYISTAISDQNWLLNAIILRLFILSFEIGSIIVLPKILSTFNVPKEKALLYILNPLIIVELCGNLHFEAAMIFLLLLFILMYKKKRFFQSGLFMAGAILFKLLPLIFLPALLKRSVKRNQLIIYLAIAVVCLLAFLPFLNSQFISNFASSLDLYFQKFEFNGSLYYFLRFLGLKLSGYNQISIIGPFLALLVFSLIFFISLSKKFIGLKIYQIWFWSILVFLLCTTTVHPWYLATLILLNCFLDFKFVPLWSFLIVFTYFNYSGPAYKESLWIVGIEYGLVFLMLLYELLNKNVKLHILKRRTQSLIHDPKK